MNVDYRGKIIWIWWEMFKFILRSYFQLWLQTRQIWHLFSNSRDGHIWDFSLRRHEREHTFSFALCLISRMSRRNNWDIKEISCDFSFRWARRTFSSRSCCFISSSSSESQSGNWYTLIPNFSISSLTLNRRMKFICVWQQGRAERVWTIFTLSFIFFISAGVRQSALETSGITLTLSWRAFINSTSTGRKLRGVNRLGYPFNLKSFIYFGVHLHYYFPSVCVLM